MLLTTIVAVVFSSRLIVGYAQKSIFSCTFDTGFIGDCQFRRTAGFTLFLTSGVDRSTDGKTTQPLSDVTSIASLTRPGNKPCLFPCTYPSGSWTMYFCRRHSDTNFTCPIEDGIGQCVFGNYAYVRSTGAFDQTYQNDIRTRAETSHCLDFYYFLTNTANETLISFGWETSTGETTITEVTAQEENKWQHHRSSFMSPSSSIYQIWFRMRRTRGSAALFHALDQIEITEGSCDTPSPSTPSSSTATVPSSSSATAYEITTQGISTQIFDITSTEISTLQETTMQTTVFASAVPEMVTMSSVVDHEPSSSSTRTTETTSLSTDTSSPLTAIINRTIAANTTASRPQGIHPILRCDFTSTTCFEDLHSLVITNGTQLIHFDINHPPRAPLSDITSITQSTSDHNPCRLPYRLSTHAKTMLYDMWFCYQNECPTDLNQRSTCTSGNYGLVSLGPAESSKTIVTAVSRPVTKDESTGEQCLRYYFYLSVYEGMNWGQEIIVSIKSQIGSDTAVEIDRIGVSEMIDNRWHSRNLTFNTRFVNYTLIFQFNIAQHNRQESRSAAETVYFALDDIEVYDQHYSCVRRPATIPTTAEMSTESTSTKRSEGALTVSKPKSNSVVLILGISLGLGIPLLLVVIGGILFRWRKLSRSHDDLDAKNGNTIPMTSLDGKSLKSDTTYPCFF